MGASRDLRIERFRYNIRAYYMIRSSHKYEDVLVISFADLRLDFALQTTTLSSATITGNLSTCTDDNIDATKVRPFEVSEVPTFQNASNICIFLLFFY